MKYINYKHLRKELEDMEDKKLLQYLREEDMTHEYCLGFICAVQMIKEIADDMALDNTKCIIAAERGRP